MDVYREGKGVNNGKRRPNCIAGPLGNARG